MILLLFSILENRSCTSKRISLYWLEKNYDFLSVSCSNWHQILNKQKLLKIIHLILFGVKSEEFKKEIKDLKNESVAE